jgi:hypothetical protein
MGYVVSPRLLKGLHFLYVFRNVHSEGMTTRQHNAEAHFPTAEDSDRLFRAWQVEFTLQ